MEMHRSLEAQDWSQQTPLPLILLAEAGHMAKFKRRGRVIHPTLLPIAMGLQSSWGEHGYRKRQGVEANEVIYQKHLLCARPCAQRLGFTVDGTVQVTVLTDLTMNM